jgi:hypothetical protein
LEFEMPSGADYFTLEVSGNRIHQGLFDLAKVPPSEIARVAAEPPVVQAVEPEPPSAEAVDEVEEADWKNIDLKMADDHSADDEKKK